MNRCRRCCSGNGSPGLPMATGSMARVVAVTAAIPARVRQAQRKPPDLSKFSSLACLSAGLCGVRRRLNPVPQREFLGRPVQTVWGSTAKLGATAVPPAPVFDSGLSEWRGPGHPKGCFCQKPFVNQLLVEWGLGVVSGRGRCWPLQGSHGPLPFTSRTICGLANQLRMRPLPLILHDNKQKREYHGCCNVSNGT